MCHVLTYFSVQLKAIGLMRGGRWVFALGLVARKSLAGSAAQKDERAGKLVNPHISSHSMN